MNDPRTMFGLAVGHLQRGDAAAAEEMVRAILAEHPKQVDSMQFLGVLLARQKRLDEACSLLEECLDLRPGDAAALTNLGETLRQMGRTDEAIGHLEQAVSAAPGFAAAHYNLGIALRQRGDDDGAVASYRRALELDPSHVDARFNLANVLREQGRTPLAVAEYERVVAARPDWAEPRLNYGNALVEMGNFDGAMAEYKRAQELDPRIGDIATNIGELYARQGRTDEAAKWLEVNLDRYPDPWLRKLRIASLAENIPGDNASIDAYRTSLLETIAGLLGEKRSLHIAGLSGSACEPPMGLLYQGRDERPIRDAYGDLFAGLMDPPEPLPGEGKPHVGIVVTNGHEGVFYRCLGSLVERLDRSKLRVTIVCSLAGRNILRHTQFETPQDYLVLPYNIEEAAQLLRAARFHVLHYWEVGTDSMNYFLPFLRPAAVQSMSWGWPVTSGNPRMDLFVSARGLEPADGASHYRERLVTIESPPTYYRRPPVPASLRNRSSFGLPESTGLYFCTQNLRKVHPDFDAAIAGILRTDPGGWVLFIADEQPAVTSQLISRLTKTCPDVRDRIRVLPRMSREEYLNVLSLVDVNLDTFHYGSGANTIYDTIATATPIVTMPGRYHRGRYALATLEAIGVRETVVSSVEDYVTMAVGLGQERDYRESIREKLRGEQSQAVFESMVAVRAYEAFFLGAAAGDVGAV